MNFYESFKKSLNEGSGNWYGIPGIKFIYRGDWSDPAIECEGLVYNTQDTGIEDSMYYELKEELGRDPSNSEFEEYMRKNGDNIKSDLSMYVPEGVADWVTSAIENCIYYEDIDKVLNELATKTAIPEEIIKVLREQYDSEVEDGEEDAIDQILAVLDEEIQKPEYYNI